MTTTVRRATATARISPQRLVGLALLSLTLTGCGSQTAAPAAAARVENSGLGLAIAILPEAFEVAENVGESLRLTAPDVAGSNVEITIGPLHMGGINLVEVVKEELMTPSGPAYTTRGQLTGPDGPVEVTAVYSLPPDGSDRLMTVTYSYPGGGDSQARVGELLELLGEIESL
jgi:hypothetical protein